MNAYASAFYVRLSTFSALVGTMQSCENDTPVVMIPVGQMNSCLCMKKQPLKEGTAIFKQCIVHENTLFSIITNQSLAVIASEAKQSAIQNSTKNLTTTKSTNLNATTGKSYREPL